MSIVINQSQFRKNLKAFLKDAYRGEPIILMRWNTPLAAVISIEEYAELQLLREEKKKMGIDPAISGE